MSRKSSTGRSAGLLAAAACVAGLGIAAPAEAHHAIGAVVDTDKQVVTTMVLTKVDWINPHAWFHFTAKTAKGTTLPNVMVEWLSLAGMKQAGYQTVAAFPVGQTYTVTYNPNRDGSPGGHIVQMVGADGKVYER